MHFMLIVSTDAGIVEASLDFFPLIPVLTLFLPYPRFVYPFWVNYPLLRGMRRLSSDRPRAHVPVPVICFIERSS